MHSSSCSRAVDEAAVGVGNKHAEISLGINHYVPSGVRGSSDVERTLNQFTHSLGTPAGRCDWIASNRV